MSCHLNNLSITVCPSIRNLSLLLLETTNAISTKLNKNDLYQVLVVYIVQPFLAHLSQYDRVSFCDPVMSVVCVSVNNLLKQHLQINCMANFDETLQECSLLKALPKLFKELYSMRKSGCHGNFFLRTTRPRIQLFCMQHRLVDLYQDCSNHDPRGSN